MTTTPALSTVLGLVVGPVEFADSIWLLLIPLLSVLSWWIARRSIAGLSSGARRAALVIRIVVIVIIACVLAQPSTRRVSENVAVTVVLDASRSVPVPEQRAVEAYLDEVRRKTDNRRDWLGVVTVARDAYVQALPSRLTSEIDRQFIGQTDASDLAAGVRRATAIAPPDAAYRVLLISDGNETAGSLLAAARAAQARGIAIDVLPVRYEYPAEVIVERLVAPGNARGGETIDLSVVVTATQPTRGRILITQNGEAVDLDPDSPGMGREVTLGVGKNVLGVPVEPTRPGAQEFEAIFEPLPDQFGDLGDSVMENNRAASVTFVQNEGYVLIVSDDSEEHKYLEAALIESGLRVVIEPPDRMPSRLTELGAYEAIVVLNQEAFAFSEAQQETLRQYAHDTGGGLVVIGGPSSFGAGGWIGSPLEDALPIRLDPPQKRQMPRGALVLVMHSIEAPNGVYYGKETARAAASALSRLDLIGINEFTGFTTDWTFPIQPLGDGAAVNRAINSLQFGDMPSFDPSLQLALQGLQAADAGQKHCIVISDGDPSLNRSILQQFRNSNPPISISTVGVYPHSPGDFGTLRRMASVTGGTFYAVETNAALATLPQIFIKEAQTVRRTLIAEGEFQPELTGAPTETLRGIGGVPMINGYVVAAEREGRALTTLQASVEIGEGRSAEVVQDPIAAQWQYGLGRVVAFTSDATSRWSSSWIGWSGYRQFWEQHVRWAMRPAGSSNVRVLTEQRGDRTAVVVDMLDERGERVNFAQIEARTATPDNVGADVEFRQVGPGRYEAEVETDDPGAYVLTLRYRAPGVEPGDPPLEGSLQAAVTRPFADEFRALETNEPLLRQVAELTGGEVLERNPEADEPWRREGLEKPVARQPIWLAVAIAAVGLFLADVGIRRVRIEPAAILASLRRGAKAAQARATGENVGALRTARERARSRTGDDEQTKAERAKRKARKFEAPADAPGFESGAVLSGETEKPAIEGLSKPAPKAAKKSDEEEGGISRLMAAKRRAREEMNKREGKDA